MNSSYIAIGICGNDSIIDYSACISYEKGILVVVVCMSEVGVVNIYIYTEGWVRKFSCD